MDITSCTAFLLTSISTCCPSTVCKVDYYDCFYRSDDTDEIQTCARTRISKAKDPSSPRSRVVTLPAAVIYRLTLVTAVTPSRALPREVRVFVQLQRRLQRRARRGGGRPLCLKSDVGKVCRAFRRGVCYAYVSFFFILSFPFIIFVLYINSYKNVRQRPYLSIQYTHAHTHIYAQCN